VHKLVCVTDEGLVITMKQRCEESKTRTKTRGILEETKETEYERVRGGKREKEVVCFTSLERHSRTDGESHFKGKSLV